MTTTTPRIALMGTLLTMALAACAQGTSDTTSSYAIDRLASRAEMQLVLRSYDGVADLLPNVSYRSPDGSQREGTVNAVIGTVVGTERGRAYMDTESGAREVPYGSTEATWRTVHLVIRVDEQLGGTVVPAEIRVGLSTGDATDIRRFRRALASLGRVLLLLEPGGPVFQYDPRLFSLPESGALLATIDAADRIDVRSSG